VKFHDGTPLRPADVVASINRVMADGSPLAFALLMAPGKATASGNTVKIVTEKPFGALESSLAVLAHINSFQIRIMI